MLGQLLDDHEPGSYAIAANAPLVVAAQPTESVTGLSATAYHRATPGTAARTLTLSYSPLAYSGSFGCPSATCTEHDGVWVRRQSRDVISLREVGFVRVTGSAAYFQGAGLDTITTLARDARIAPTVEQSLADAAAANPRWRTDDLGCGNATTSAPIALPPAAGTSQPVTPQALAAVLAGRVSGSCAGDDSRDDAPTGTLYLGSDTERVSLTISTTPYRCPQLDSCRTENGLTVARQTDLPEPTYPTHLVVARALPDGVHWVIVDEASVRAHKGEAPVALGVLNELVNEPRLGRSVDAALNQAGDELPLRWRLTPRTSE